jgi:F420-non-reducing hydrogenase iron-sulfur subunit
MDFEINKKNDANPSSPPFVKGGLGGLVEPESFDPKIIAMVCTYCTYTAADMAGSMRLQYPHNVRVVKYLCTGKIDIQHMLKVFERGADALLVGG